MFFKNIKSKILLMAIRAVNKVFSLASNSGISHSDYYLLNILMQLNNEKSRVVYSRFQLLWSEKFSSQAASCNFSYTIRI